MDYKESAKQAYNHIKTNSFRVLRQAKDSYQRYWEQKQAEKENYTPADRFARQSAWATIIIAVLTAVNVGVGINQAIIYNGQLDVMRSQLKEMHDSGNQENRLIGANVTLSEAANRSANTAADSLIVTQRAYLGTTDANVVGLAIGQVIKGNVLYTNSGKEPAKFEANADVMIFSKDDWDGTVANNDLAKRQDVCLQKNDIVGERYAWPIGGFNSYFIHFPKGVIPQAGVYVWDPDTLNGGKIVVVDGCITYIAFSAIHHTAFCYFFNAAVTDASHLNVCITGNRVN